MRVRSSLDRPPRCIGYVRTRWEAVALQKGLQASHGESSRMYLKGRSARRRRASYGVKCALEFVGISYFQRLKAHAQRWRCSFYNAPVGIEESAVWVPQDSQVGRCWDNLNEQLRLFGGNVGACIESNPRDVSTGTWKALDKTLAYGIACICKNDWDRRGRLFSHLGGR